MLFKKIVRLAAGEISGVEVGRISSILTCPSLALYSVERSDGSNVRKEY